MRSPGLSARGLPLSPLWPVAVLGAALLVASCGGGGGSPSGSPAQTSVTRERTGVRLTLSVDRAVYKPGQKVKAKAEAINVSGEQITYAAAVGQPVFSLAVAGELIEPQILNAGSTAPAAGDALAPGASVTAEASWDQMLQIPNVPIQAPPAQYVITAQLLVAGLEGATIPVSAAVTFRVEGSQPVVSPQDALKAALAADDVKAWFKDRSPTPVCIYPGRGLFYIGNVQTGEVNESLEIVYKASQSNGQPICSIITSKEGWWLLFFGTEDHPPRIQAWVDLHSGEFIRMEEGGPTPVPATPVPTFTPPRG